MQTIPTPAPAARRTIPAAPAPARGVALASLTPAQRIALTIAVLNRGLDLMDGFARTSLARCTRGTRRAQHASEGPPHP